MSASIFSTPTLSDDQSWRVMVVEDNHAVAAVHRRIVDSVPYLRTAHVAFNGEHAFQSLDNVRPDLVILDLSMPGGNGMSFLRRLRATNSGVDVIIVTASKSSRVVKEAMHLGVVDYLVKPFSPQRLRESMSNFALRRRTLERRSELDQAGVDAIRAFGPRSDRRRLPKGFTEDTMKAVLAALSQPDRSLTAEDVGQEVGIARVTARRYLEYLTLMGLVKMSRETSGPGRPRNHYQRVRARDKPKPVEA